MPIIPKNPKSNTMNLKSFTRTVLPLFILVASYCTPSNAQQQLTDLPTFHINTENKEPITSKDVYVQGTLTIKSSDEFEESDIPLEIRGRGNSTWSMAKKPYRIKLASKKNLLGLPAKEKNWVLLANYADKTLMRNALALKISKMVGLEFTPSVKFVDVVLNGTVLGNYMLTDQVEVADFRVPVEKQSTSAITEPDITGGYLLEIDGFAAAEPVWFTTQRALKITVKYPKDDEINTAQLNYIKSYINNFENKLFSSDFKNPETGYRSLVDETSLVNWYLACELTGNSDSFWSTYIYKKKNDPRIFFGPMWDYDIAFNNDDRLGDATKKLMREHAFHPRTWIEQLWKDEWFRNAVKERLNELIEENITEELTNYIAETALLLENSQKLNFQKWNILNRKVYRETYLFNTYKGGVDYLKSYVKNRINFLSTGLVAEEAKPSVPFVADESYWYMIMNKGTCNVIDVENGSDLSGSSLVMWQPDGDSDTQLWRIVNAGNNTFNIINKQSGLAIAGNGRANNLKQILVDNTDKSQKWKITAVHTGDIYGIENTSSGYSVNNSGGGTSNGTPVIEYDNNIHLQEKVNQHWFFQKTDPIQGSTITGISSAGLSYRIDDNYLNISNIPSSSTIKLINLQGYIIAERKNISGEISIPVLRSGIYILSVISNESGENIKIYVK